MKEMRNACKILVWKSNEKGPYERLGFDGAIISKRMFQKYSETGRTKCNWRRVGHNGGIL
jgi:hypothetical protein